MNPSRVMKLVLLVLLGANAFLFYSIYARNREDAKHIKLEKSETRTFRLVGVDPPKHFYIDIKDVETEEVTNYVYVSKHCNSWRETAVVGKAYQVVVETYYDDRDNSRNKEYKDLYEILCK